MLKRCFYLSFVISIVAAVLLGDILPAQPKTKATVKGAGQAKTAQPQNPQDARNAPTVKVPQPRDPEYAKYAIYEQSAPRPAAIVPIATTLPLDLKPGDHIAFIGN